jgi:hypothetical protein
VIKTGVRGEITEKMDIGQARSLMVAFVESEIGSVV